MIENIDKPILSFHGKKFHLTDYRDWLNCDTSNLFYASVFGCFHPYKKGIHGNEYINSGKDFMDLYYFEIDNNDVYDKIWVRRYWDRKRIREMYSEELQFCEGKDVVLCTHFGFEYSNIHHSRFEKKAYDMINTIDRLDLDVVDIRDFIRRYDKNDNEPQGT